MKPRFGRSAASVAAALFLVLPGAARATDQPVRPVNPSFEVWESDPWRPDVGPPDRNVALQAGQTAPEAARLAERQPANRNERWTRIVLRYLLAYLTGGAR